MSRIAVLVGLVGLAAGLLIGAMGAGQFVKPARTVRVGAGNVALCDGSSLTLPDDVWNYKSEIGEMATPGGIGTCSQHPGVVQTHHLASGKSTATLRWDGGAITTCLAPGEPRAFDWLTQRFPIAGVSATPPAQCPDAEGLP